LKKLTFVVAVTLVAALLATGSFADLRQGNVRAKADCSIPPYDCIYTQAGWHKTEGSWYVSSNGMWSDGILSEYFAYPFGICCDSTVRDIYIGGGFGYFTGQEMPTHGFTVDIYKVEDTSASCQRDAGAGGCCYPGALYKRYTIPDANTLYPTDWSDAIGCIYGVCGGFDDFEKIRVTLNPPLALDADAKYLLAFYANVDMAQGDLGKFNATIDMLCGQDNFCMTTDCGVTWGCWYWFGGTVASGLDIELRGDVGDCSCLCDYCAQEGWKILYDQASKHSHTTGSLWAAMSWGGGYPNTATNIDAQAFNYQWDGYLKCIGIGGSFGQFAAWSGGPNHNIPNNLIVELWCMAQQEATAEPVTLLRRWIVPVPELLIGEDPDGHQLMNFFTEDYPGPYTWCDTTAPGGTVWAEDNRPYMFVAYSDGVGADQANNIPGAPLEWYVDMSKGYCSYSYTDDCEFTWNHNYYFGDPRPPTCSPEANYEFILCGGCQSTHAPTTGDEAVTTGYLAGPLFGSPQAGYPGWVWFSVPLDPANCCTQADCYDPTTLLGFTCNGILWKWDKYGKYTQVYQPPFLKWDLEVGNSYLIRLNNAVNNPTYTGVNPYVSARPNVDRQVPPKAKGEPGVYKYGYPFQLGKQGWTWVGLPGYKPVYGGGVASDFGNKVMVQYPADASGVTRTAGYDVQQGGASWINWGWAYFDTTLQATKTFKFNLAFGNRHCYPWVGYRVYVNVGSATAPYCPGVSGNEDQAVLIWPAPECFYGM
jgi:hypothetical protein